MWRWASLEPKTSRTGRICVWYREVSRICKQGSKNWSGYWLWWEALSCCSLLTCSFCSTCPCSSAGSSQQNWVIKCSRFWASWHAARLHQAALAWGNLAQIMWYWALLNHSPCQSQSLGLTLVWVKRVQRGRCWRMNFQKIAREVQYYLVHELAKDMAILKGNLVFLPLKLSVNSTLGKYSI